MNININKINEYERELLITVSWEDIVEDYNELLKRYMKIPIKGFRPGKTPVGAIESFFRNEIKNDLLARVSSRFCRKALKDENIVSGSPIEIVEGELKKNESISFKAAFIEMPQFDLPDYRKLNLESTTQAKQINEISEKLLERTTIMIPPSFIEAELGYSEESDDSQEQRDAAAERVKLMLIIKKIAEQDGIEIDERDVDERMEMIAEEHDVEIADIKMYFMESGGTGRLSDALLAERVLEYIIGIQE